MRSLKESHSVGPLQFFDTQFAVKCQKVRWGPLETLKLFEKSLIAPKKIKGGPFWARPVL